MLCFCLPELGIPAFSLQTPSVLIICSSIIWGLSDLFVQMVSLGFLAPETACQLLEVEAASGSPGALKAHRLSNHLVLRPLPLRVAPRTTRTYSSRVIYTNGSSHDSICHSARSSLFAKLISIFFSLDNTFPPVVFILGSVCLLALKTR